MKEETKKTKPRDKKRVFILMGIAAVFFVVGMQLFPFIFNYIIPHTEGVMVVNTEMSAMFKLSMLMGFAFAIIPFAINSGWQLLKLDSTAMKAFFALVVLCGAIAAIIIRHLMLEKMAEELYIPNVLSPIHLGQIRAAESVMVGTIGAWLLAMVIFTFFRKKPTAGSSPKTT